MRAKLFRSLLLLALLSVLAACGQGPLLVPSTQVQSDATLESLGGEKIPIPELQASIVHAMDKAGVTGLSVAIVNGDQIAYQEAFGVKDARDGSPNDEETIFSAASFSKPVFAYLVMLLAEEGIVDLDRPLHEYLSQPLPDYPNYADLEGDERYRQITARMVLSHGTGFPNWRFLTEDGKLRIMFPPGTRYSYSGEGISLLQMAVEEITGRSLEDLAQEMVFQPLGMTHSSYVWQEAYEDNYALPHDEFEQPKRLNRRTTPDAAGSMSTTAEDYARLIVAMLTAQGRRKASVDEMLDPQIAITSEAMFGPGAWEDVDDAQGRGVAWGLGWGRFGSEHGPAFFHTGHDFGWQNYTVAFPDRGIAIVLLSNSDNFESVAREIAAAAIGDTYSPFDWLGYPRFDPSRKRVPPPAPVAVAVDPTILQAYVGAYELTPDQVIHFRLEGDSLYVGDGEYWEPLLAESETQFFSELEEDTRFIFQVDDNGAVIGLVLRIQGMELPLALKVE